MPVPVPPTPAPPEPASPPFRQIGEADVDDFAAFLLDPSRTTPVVLLSPDPHRHDGTPWSARPA